VPAGEEADHREPDDVGLPDEGPADGLLEPPDQLERVRHHA